MKALILRIAILASLSPIITFSAVGKHNFTFNVGGAFNISTIYGNANQSTSIRERSTEYLGGGFNIELGHLYLSSEEIIHGLDTRVGFSMNLDRIYTISGSTIDSEIDINFNTISAYIGTTYIVGKKISNGRIMIDIAGLDLGFFTGDQSTLVIGATSRVFTGNHLLLSLNLPLGTQYISDKGLMIGFRHQLDMAFANRLGESLINSDGVETTVRPTSGGAFGTSRTQQTLLSYSITFSLGYAIGK